MVLLLGKIFPSPKSDITRIHVNTRLSKYRLSFPLWFTMYIELHTELFVFLKRTYVRLSDHFGTKGQKTKNKVGLNQGRITCVQRKLCTVDVGFADRLITAIYFLQ